MRVIDQLVDYLRHTTHWSEELESRLVALGLVQRYGDEDSYYESEDCDWCGHYHCICEWFDVTGDDERRRWEVLDAARRKHVSHRLRGKRGRRREATVEVVRQSVSRQLEKWSLPGGRLDHLLQVGALLNCRGHWQRAARTMLALPVPRLVDELARAERYSVRPLFNRLHDLDLAWQSFARPWRGQAGAALRRLVDQSSDKRSRKLLRHTEFQDVELQVKLAVHLKLARQYCYDQRRHVQKYRNTLTSAG